MAERMDLSPLVRPQQLLQKEAVKILCDTFPTGDVDFFRNQTQGINYYSQLEHLVNNFIENGFPVKKQPPKPKAKKADGKKKIIRKLTTEFEVDDFLKEIPDPDLFFTSRNINFDKKYHQFIEISMRNFYPRTPAKLISQLLRIHKFSPVRVANALNASTEKQLQLRRKPLPLPRIPIINIELLQELAYLEHRPAIDAGISCRKREKEEAKNRARDLGLLKSCNCCYAEELLDVDVMGCGNSCEFCRDCVIRSVKIAFGEGKLDFPCLNDCGNFFELEILETILEPILYTKITNKKMVQNVMSAEIENLEMCPFCDFVSILPEGNNIFTCLNPDCMVESCRICRKPSHIPFRCHETYSDETEARIFLENQMSDALIRKCNQCQLPFFKIEGCNKITCSCGAIQCYICGKTVENYEHFYGLGGIIQPELCPLYSDNAEINLKRVQTAAEESKKKIGLIHLTHDPTKDLERHFTHGNEREAQIAARVHVFDNMAPIQW